MSLTLGNGFGNFKRPLNLRKKAEETKNETKAPEIKGGMKADKPQTVDSLEYTAKAPITEGTPTEPNIHEGGSNGNSTFGDLYGEEPSYPIDPDPTPEPDNSFWGNLGTWYNHVLMGENNKKILNDINNNFKS